MTDRRVAPPPANEPDDVGLCGRCERAAADPAIRSCCRPDCPLARKEAA